MEPKKGLFAITAIAGMMMVITSLHYAYGSVKSEFRTMAVGTQDDTIDSLTESLAKQAKEHQEEVQVLKKQIEMMVESSKEQLEQKLESQSHQLDDLLQRTKDPSKDPEFDPMLELYVDSQRQSDELNELLGDVIEQDDYLARDLGFAKNLDPKGKKIVVITACDEHARTQNETQFELVLKNRERYAAAHGYHHVFVDTTDFHTEHRAWGKVVAIRKAFEQHPDAEWFWWLDFDALIMNQGIDLASHLLNHEVLEQRLIRDRPLKDERYFLKRTAPSKEEQPADQVDILWCQDSRGWNAGSMFFRNTDFTRWILDLWDDPLLIRGSGYNEWWWHHEQSTLAFLAMRHDEFFKKFGTVPQTLLNSYPEESRSYEPGHLVVHFAGNVKGMGSFGSLWDKFYYESLSDQVEGGQK